MRKPLWIGAVLGLAAGLLMPSAAPAKDLPPFRCGDPKAEWYAGLCESPELTERFRHMRRRFEEVAKRLEPAAAMLLKRDQRWAEEIIGSFGIVRPEHFARIGPLLEKRIAWFNQIDTGPTGTPAGRWTNVFGTVTVEPATEGALRVAVAIDVPYEDADDPIACTASATLKPAANGWFAGLVEGGKVDAGGPPQLRLVLQGGTLRLVSTGSIKPCSHVSAPLTGNFFRVAGSAPAGAVPRSSPVVAPSFDCRTTASPDGEEICADPDLARADSEMAREYGVTAKRLDKVLAKHLAADQRAWVHDNAQTFDSFLNAPWDKRFYYVHHTDAARAALIERLLERRLFLAAIDGGRRGLDGVWASNTSSLTLKSDATGTRISGSYWVVDDYKAGCEFDDTVSFSDGRFAGNDALPALVLDGPTLVMSPASDSQPESCRRIREPRTRLLPLTRLPKNYDRDRL
jgi:hypothetical protein